MENEHTRFAHILKPMRKDGFSYLSIGIPALEGEFLWSQIRNNQYHNTIEIGCAFGISSLYICDALSASQNWSHTIIDPYQTTDWNSIGIKNLKSAGFTNARLIESLSEIALPHLLEEEQIFDFGFIDGWHTFDHTLVDFFYLNRLIRVGGMIVFDDVRFPSISRVARYVAKYPSYELVDCDYGVALSRKYQYIIQIGYSLSNIFPQKLRQILFSDNILFRHQVNLILLQRPRWIAFRKVADDTRDYEWFENF